VNSLSILLVTDDASVEQLVRAVVHPWSDVVGVFASAGLAMESRVAVDVAVVDLDVQRGAGLALVHFLRARDPRLCIVALVHAGDTEGEVVAQALGCNTILVKPLTGDPLLVSLSPVRELKAMRAVVSARVSSVPLAPVLQAQESRALAASIAEAAHKITGGAARAVVDDPREGSVEARAGIGDPEDAIPLVAHDESIGTLFVTGVHDQQPRQDLDLLALSGATVGVLLRRADAAARVGIKDPETSAYTFSYFVDVAGREIERARRHGRRFALLTFLVDNYAELRERSSVNSLREARRELVDTVLDTVRDTDILAHVEDDELYLLVPEAGMLGALSCRRRIADKQRKRAELARLEGRPGYKITIGVATFPRDGRDLASLLRAAHKRNAAARQNIAAAVARASTGGLAATLGAMLRVREDDRNWMTRQTVFSTSTLIAGAAAVAREVARGSGKEGVFYIVGDRTHVLVQAAIEAVAAANGSTTSIYWLRPKRAAGATDSAPPTARAVPVEIEVDGDRIGPFALLVALTESWAYACVAAEQGDYKRILHTAELDAVEALLAELQNTFHLQRGLE